VTAAVAALFVDPKGPYWGRPDVEAWDESRDARRYRGPLPVVAHPPCGRWCRLAKLVESRYPQMRVGDDGGCFSAALAAVRVHSGVLEHPAWSLAWAAHNLIVPDIGGWTRVIDYTASSRIKRQWSRCQWVCEVNQAAYGHAATKATWLYYVGLLPPAPMNWSRAKGTKVISGMRNRCNRPLAERLWSRDAHVTPPAFAEALLFLVRNSGGAP
jgi:hypothetical protein